MGQAYGANSGPCLTQIVGQARVELLPIGGSLFLGLNSNEGVMRTSLNQTRPRDSPLDHSLAQQLFMFLLRIS